MAKSPNVSIVIHTKNEETNIPYLLRSIAGKFEQVFVVDAGSTDRTKEICGEFEVEFVQIEGDRSTLVKQRNWALNNLPFENEWVFILDADEQMTEELFAEISSLFSAGGPPDDVDAYLVRYKEIIFGRWVKRAGFYPNWGIRLIRQRVVRHETRAVNSSLKADPDRTRRLMKHFIHDDKRGYSAYIKRLASVSLIEAQTVSEIYDKDTDQIEGKMFSSDPLRRRRALKKLFYRLPGRPLIIFVYLYVVRGGFLEGWPGYYSAYLRMTHETFVGAMAYDLKKKEIKYDGN